ncbi:MAG: TfoX/Sxy family protein [Candidatus Dormiibacterota bacterium]
MYDQALAQRIRKLLHAEPNVTEMRMFGGLAFLVNGNMSVSASGHGGMLLHVNPGDTAALVAEPHVQPAVMRGRVMRGWLRVDEGGVQSAAQLEHWVMRGVAYARSLPTKQLSGHS